MPDDELFDYKGEMDRLLLFGRALLDIDLDRMKQTMDEAHAVGWVIDPTRYRDALQDGRLDWQEKVIDAARPLQNLMRELVAEVEGSSPG